MTNMPDREAFATTHVPPRHGAGHDIAVADVRNPLLHKGIALWERQRAARRFPGRDDMSPRVLAGLLRNTVLVRVLGDDFQFRIVGDAIVAAQGSSFQGKTTAEIEAVLPGYGRMLHHVYREVCKAGTPHAYRGWFERSADGRAFYHETVVLPLGVDGEAVDHLLVLAVYAYTCDQVLR
jgi:hypothetical protein